MKTKEELNVIKDEIDTLNKKLSELTEDELNQVTGGDMRPGYVYPGIAVVNDCIGALNSTFSECISPEKKGTLNNCSQCRFNR